VAERGADAGPRSRQPERLPPGGPTLGRVQALLWLAAIVALGAFLRLWRLDAVPAGLFFDVAANLFDVLEVRDGARPIWFVRNNGREPFVLYAEALASLAFGPTALAAKAATATIGIAAIPACYLLGREVGEAFGSRVPRRTGLIAAFLVATLYWHLNFSRIGLRTIALPLFLALGVGLLLRAVRSDSRLWAVAGGLATGGAVYTYLSSRLTPLFLLPGLVALWLAWRRRSLVLALYVAAAAAAVAPFAYYYLGHRADLEGRAAAISVLNAEISRGDPLGASLRGLAVTAASTVWQGTRSGMENLPLRPLFEPVTAAMFLLGCALALLALARPDPRRRAVSLLLLLWLVVMMLPSALSVDPPNFSRITGIVAAAVALAAVGYDRLIAWTRPAAALLLAVPLLWTSYDYFVVWAPSEVSYRWMMADKVQGSERVQRWLADGERVFLAPLYARDWTYMFLLRDTGVESFEVAAALVVPAEGPVRYAFPPDDPHGLATVAERLGTGRLEMVADQSGRYPLLSTLVVDTPARSDPAPLARFEDGVELVDVEPTAARLRPGETLRLRLGWRASARPSREYTVFVHGRDAANANRFQRDRRPGDGSVPTTRWRPGDRVHDYVETAIPADLAAGEYRVVVGMYDGATGRRLELPEVAGRPNELAVARVTIGP
jgi:4-amino-4-deoxy-L-arabinose transferase-like glycosyltransferase